jgi:hypothetical protein
LLPTMGFLPVTSQTRAIRSTPKVKINGFRRTSHCPILLAIIASQYPQAV